MEPLTVHNGMDPNWPMIASRCLILIPPNCGSGPLLPDIHDNTDNANSRSPSRAKVSHARRSLLPQNGRTEDGVLLCKDICISQSMRASSQTYTKDSPCRRNLDASGGRRVCFFFETWIMVSQCEHAHRHIPKSVMRKESWWSMFGVVVRRMRRESMSRSRATSRS